MAEQILTEPKQNIVNFLITGATGLVGTRVTELLIEKGHTVNYLTTRNSKIEKSDRLNGFFWDPVKGLIDEDCFKNVQCIINLAGANVAQRWSSSHKASILKSRIDALNLLFSKLQRVEHSITQLISASAIGIYPHSYKHIYQESELKPNEDFLGGVVQKWESAATQFESIGINVAKIRIGIVLSKDGGALAKMAKPIKSYVGARLGFGKQWQSWIHIDDLADMFLFISKNRLTGVYNGVAPNPVTNTEMTRAIARRLKKPLVLPPVPGFVIKLIFGEMGSIVLSSQRVSSEKIENEGFRFEFKTIYDALSDIDD